MMSPHPYTLYLFNPSNLRLHSSSSHVYPYLLIIFSFKVAKTRDMLKRNKWDSYMFWTLNLFTLIDACLSVKNVLRDENVLSEKSTFIVAIKKLFLTRSLRH